MFYYNSLHIYLIYINYINVMLSSMLYTYVKRKIREWRFNMGSTERYSSEYGPEKICRARVINKDEKKETIYGHPNATVSDILGRTYHVIRKFVTFSNDDGREFKLDNENAYDTFEIGDKANLTLRESFIAIWDYQPPNFD